jgi:hypothetical protein
VIKIFPAQITEGSAHSSWQSKLNLTPSQFKYKKHFSKIHLNIIKWSFLFPAHYSVCISCSPISSSLVGGGEKFKVVSPNYVIVSHPHSCFQRPHVVTSTKQNVEPTIIIVTLPKRSGAPHESPSASYSSTVTSDCCDVTVCTWARFTGTGVNAGIMHLSPASSDTYNDKNTPAPQKLQLFVLFESIFCKTALFQLQRLYSLNGIWRWS